MSSINKHSPHGARVKDVHYLMALQSALWAASSNNAIIPHLHVRHGQIRAAKLHSSYNVAEWQAVNPPQHCVSSPPLRRRCLLSLNSCLCSLVSYCPLWGCLPPLSSLY